LRIALDIQGGDYAPHALVLGAQYALKKYTDIQLLLVGSEQSLNQSPTADLLSSFGDRIQTLISGDPLPMQASPVQGLKAFPRSSILEGIKAVSVDSADAFITAGNSGAAVVAATQHIPRLRKLRRPAMAVLFPGRHGETVLLDVGAQSQCTPAEMVQIAQLGSSFAQHILQKPEPTVGLINMGEESTKGPSHWRNTHQLLAHSALNFYGNIEGWDLPLNKVDVAVCDGFTGNIVLKLTEGLSEFFMDICPELNHTPETARFRYTEHGGSLVLGLEKLVIITHGRAQAVAIANAITLARRTLLNQTLMHMKEDFERLSP
jgi:phosphate acyltransferase